MTAGSALPGGHPGSRFAMIPELFGGDPSAVGLPRTVGWRVMLPDGSAAWDKFGPNDTDWTPVAGGTAGPVTSVNGLIGAVTIPISVTGVSTTGATRISTIGSSTLTAGAVAWSTAVGAPFWLVPQGLLTLDPMTTVAASGKPGFVWSRLAVKSAGAEAVTTWHVDPLQGSDEASGTGTGASALKTCAEWNRRTYCAQVGFITLNLDNDIPDGDTIVNTLQANTVNGSRLSIVGSTTVVATVTLTSAVARNAATNQANEVTATAFDWSTHVNQLCRPQGSTNYAAITKSISLGTARLGELITATGTQASTTGITAGVVEIVSTRKGPLQLTSVGNCPVFTFDVRFAGTGTVIIALKGVGNVLSRTIFQGTTGANVYMLGGGNYQTWGGIVCPGSNWVFGSGQIEGTAFTQSGSWQNPSQYPGYVKIRSTVFQGAQQTLASCIMHVDGDMGTFDLASGQLGIIVGNGVTETATVHFNSGRHYGAGNDANSTVWQIGVGSYVAYLNSQPPTMNAALGINLPTGNVALGSLPVNFNVSNGTAVYAQ